MPDVVATIAQMEKRAALPFSHVFYAPNQAREREREIGG